MLNSEFIAEWDKQITIHRQQLADNGRNVWYAPPVVLQPHVMDYVMTFYSRHELDSILTGPGRHANFVAWIIGNWEWIERETTAAKMRADEKLSYDLRQMAAERAIKAK